jgi:hypothetical protein
VAHLDRDLAARHCLGFARWIWSLMSRHLLLGNCLKLLFCAIDQPAIGLAHPSAEKLITVKKLSVLLGYETNFRRSIDFATKDWLSEKLKPRFVC